MKQRRWICRLLALAMLTLALCGAMPAAAAENAQEPIEITAVLQLNPEIVLDDNPVIQLIEQELNIRLKVEAPPQSTYGDRVKMLVSSGDMPDLVHYGTDTFAKQWAEEGLLLDVTDLVGNYPNLARNITQEQMGDCDLLEDGHFYGIPRPNSYDKWGYLINAKWLKAVGMGAPGPSASLLRSAAPLPPRIPTATVLTIPTAPASVPSRAPWIPASGR